MRRRLERRLWIGVALVAVLAGATAAAVMAAQPAAKHVRHHSSHRHRGDRSHMRAAVHPAALYLGVTVTQLREDVRSGKTLAQVANSTSGKSEAGLIEAILA
jgi:type II secretory pathway component PulK